MMKQNDASFNKELRYAMIRNAAVTVQQAAAQRRQVYKLIKSAERIESQDHKKEIAWNDAEAYAVANYSDVYKATCYEEWN